MALVRLGGGRVERGLVPPMAKIKDTQVVELIGRNRLGS